MSIFFRLNIQWKTVRHENETVKYTVKEVMKENEDLKESMSTMTLKMNKMNVIEASLFCWRIGIN